VPAEEFRELGGSHPALMAAGFEKVNSGYAVPIGGFYVQVCHNAATHGYPFGKAPESYHLSIVTEPGQNYLATTGLVNWLKLVELYEYAVKCAKETEEKRRTESIANLRQLLGIKD
ncbi:MAG: hypothetical protein AAB731_02880, partial [Patescibacteria group bacterium]